LTTVVPQRQRLTADALPEAVLAVVELLDLDGLAGSRYHKIPADRGARWVLAVRKRDRPKPRFKTQGTVVFSAATGEGDLL